MTNLYALREPDTEELRYVGKTIKPLGHRLSRHLSDARAGRNGYRCNWLRSLSVAPVIEVIATVNDRYASRAEQFAIALMRAGGARLVNDTDGGEGQSGRSPSTETRAKLRAASLGNKYCLGFKHTTETRAKVGAASRRRKHTPEARAKVSMARRGKKFSPEHKARISAAKIGHTLTSEHRASISAGLFRFHRGT